MAEKEGFEPSIPFWGIHDFQSCALGQLRDFSKSRCSGGRFAADFGIIHHGPQFVNNFFSFFPIFSPAVMGTFSFCKVSDVPCCAAGWFPPAKAETGSPTDSGAVHCPISGKSVSAQTGPRKSFCGHTAALLPEDMQGFHPWYTYKEAAVRHGHHR